MADETNGGLCGKCKKNPKRKGDAWCNECRNEYQRERRDSEESRQFIRGAEAMRHALISQLSQAHPRNSTTFASVIEWIGSFEAPHPQG